MRGQPGISAEALIRPLCVKLRREVKASSGRLLACKTQYYSNNGGFARRKIQVFLRRRPLFPPHDLRLITKRCDEGRRSMTEYAAMPAISHSHWLASGPVFARSGMVRSPAEIRLWQSGKEQRQAMCGWSSCRPTPCRPTIRRSPIRAFGNSFECSPGRLPANSLKPNRSVPPANASANREAVS